MSEQLQGIDKTSLDDVEAGDYVVISDRHRKRLERVSRTTKTRIVFGNMYAFMKRNGKEVGGTSWSATYAYALGKRCTYNSEKTEYDRFLEWQAETAERAEYVDLLKRLNRDVIRKLPVEKLRRMVEIAEEE